MSAFARGRLATVVVASLLLLAACEGTTTDNPASAPDPSTDTRDPTAARMLEPVVESDTEDVPSALANPEDPQLPDPLIDTGRVISGGPPPDGIPPIDQPTFEPASEVDWLTPDEPVLALSIDGEERAYPVQVMIWHEIVNDTVAGTPVSITYCPLCNSALAFDRRVGDRLLTFGTSGSLYQSDLVMYDRQTESLWPQLEGRAAVGFLTGTELKRIPIATVPWQQWLDQNPDGWVLSRDTGIDRDYGRNPYQAYDAPSTEPFLLDEKSDPRLLPKERVVAISGDDPTAIPLQAVVDERVVEERVSEEPLVIWAVAGLRSALDTAQIVNGRLVGASGVFQRTLGNRTLSFAAKGRDTFTDVQTNSTWNLLGTAVAGPLEGKQLTAVPHVDTFWFAWAAFEPDTRLLTPNA